MAKWGSPRVLESELKAESSHIRTIIKARGLWSPNVNGKTFAVFRTDKKNHLVSLVCELNPILRTNILFRRAFSFASSHTLYCVEDNSSWEKEGGKNG